MVRPTLIALTKRVPLIQFRKGGLAGGAKTTPTQQGAAQTAIEDWELPTRFARKPIDALEAQYINNGGIPN